MFVTPIENRCARRTFVAPLAFAAPRAFVRGFSLLEVMVALIIIAIGMLGIAKMQGLALSSTNSSRSRALAAIEASSLAAAMQANRTFWSSATLAPASVKIVTNAGVAPTYTATGALGTAVANAQATQCSSSGMSLSCYCVVANPCTPTAQAAGMAANDLVNFALSLGSFLPTTSTTMITCLTADTPVDCTINITWNENTVALNSQEATQSVNNGSTVPVSFSLYVVP